MKPKDIESQILAYFQKNKVVCLNSIFVKFGKSVQVIKALGLLSSTINLSGQHIEVCGELTYKVYKLK